VGEKGVNKERSYAVRWKEHISNYLGTWGVAQEREKVWGISIRRTEDLTKRVVPSQERQNESLVKKNLPRSLGKELLRSPKRLIADYSQESVREGGTREGSWKLVPRSTKGVLTHEKKNWGL